MQKTGSSRKRTARRDRPGMRVAFCAAVLVACAVGLTRARAESDADTTDLEAVIDAQPAGSSSGPAPSGGGTSARSNDADQDSIRDLEKVIADEDKKPAKPAAPAPAPRQAASAPASKAPAKPSAPSPDEDLFATPVGDKPDRASNEPELEPPNDLPAPEAEIVGAKTAAAPRGNRQPQVAPPASNVRNTITNLEFKMEGETSRLILSSRAPLRYREIKNPGMKQVIYYFDNTDTPERLQRAYDTTEFKSPVALFTLLQMPQESPPTSKLIVQLREEKDATVLASERGLYIDFAAPSKSLEGAPKLIIGDDKRGGPEENTFLNQSSFSGRTIKKLEIKNSDVQDVLRLIAKTSGYNIVVGDDVTGKVGTLSLENIPWDQAFALVLQSKKLGYIKQGNVIRVATLQTLKTEKDEQLASENAKIKVEPLRTVLIPISYAKASELAPQAKNFLTDRGTIDTDTRTNTIIVKDIERVVTRVQKLFSALDTQPPRVAISAKIVEMKTDFTRNIGFSQLGFNTSFSGVNLTYGQTLQVGATNQFTLTAPQFANLNAQFQLGELESKVKTLANPSVTVVANRQATVSQSLSFFVTDSSIAGGVQVQTARQVTTTLTMDVTPIVAGDGSIFMTLNIKNEIPTLKGANTTIDARSVNTQVLLENGDTAVVGGVFTNTVNTDREGVPLLMRVPILGHLFSREGLQDRRNEIFIFVTAKITNAEESFKRNL